MSLVVTHEVFKPHTPRVDFKLLTGNRSLQAALLRQHSTDAVFRACWASRLAQASDVFGSLPAGLDRGAIVVRTQLR